MARVAMAFRLTEEAQRLVEAMAEENGLSKTSIVEMAIREKAKRDRVKVSPKPAREERREEDAA